MTSTATPTIDTPLYLAYREALAEVDRLTAAAESCECEAGACEHEAALARAEATRDAALDAYRESDEPRVWILREMGYDYATLVGTLEEARELAGEAGETGDYDTSDGTVWTTIRVRCEDTDEDDTVTVQIDPDAPECVEGHEHDWQSPIALVGGIESNPGVWGHGGGVIITEACLRCGTKRTTDTWAQDPSTGEQGLTSVRYEAGAYDLDELGYIVEERQIPTVTRDEIEVLRSDLGDGGWSLHRGDDAQVLASGEAAWDEERGEWDRPIEADYAAALAASAEDRWVVLDRSDDTYTVATSEDDAREIAYRCRAGHAAEYTWQDVED